MTMPPEKTLEDLVPDPVERDRVLEEVRRR
jgi:transposase